MLIPPLPPAREPNQDGGAAELLPRYDEVAQDGRMRVTAFPPGLTHTVWHGLLGKHPAVGTFTEQGVLPILHRMIVEAEDRPVSASLPVRWSGGYRYARQKGGDRLFLNMWVEARAQVAYTMAPPPPADAPFELLGRVFAEHVITRPFAPPGQRKVTRLDAPGVPPVPEDEYDGFEPAEALLAGASGALEPLAETTFGLLHTDSNQHVHSMVYPRLMEEQAIVAMMRDPRLTNVAGKLARRLDIVWQKPFFAGQTVRTSACMTPGEGGVVDLVGAFHASNAPDDKPHTTLRLTFR